MSHPRGYTVVEVFAGTAALSLRLVGGRSLVAPVAFMGGKRRLARAIAEAMGIPRGKPARVVLNDAGPWGWVWPLLLNVPGASSFVDPSARICAILRSWSDEHPRDLWQRLAAVSPFEDPCEAAAQWLWLQARSASGVPVWWGGDRFMDSTGRPTHDPGPNRKDRPCHWRASNGAGAETVAGHKSLGGWIAEDGRGDPREAGQRRTSDERWASDTLRGRNLGKACQKTTEREPNRHTGGIVRVETIAERIEAIAQALRGVEVTVTHGDAGALPVRVEGPTFVFIDPPYLLPRPCTGYGWTCTTEIVIAIARAWHEAGAVVAISEGAAVPIDGWHAIELTRPGGKPEWLTLSRPPLRVPERQAVLFAPAT